MRISALSPRLQVILSLALKALVVLMVAFFSIAMAFHLPEGGLTVIAITSVLTVTVLAYITVTEMEKLVDKKLNDATNAEI